MSRDLYGNTRNVSKGAHLDLHPVGLRDAASDEMLD